MLGEELVVVLDDAVVDAYNGAVADGMVVGGEARMSLREVADMDEEVRRLLGHADALEQRRRSRTLLVDGDPGAGGAVGIAHGVGASFGDPGQEGAGRDSP